MTDQAGTQTTKVKGSDRAVSLQAKLDRLRAKSKTSMSPSAKSNLMKQIRSTKEMLQVYK